MDSILIPRIDLSVRSENESCRRDVASVAVSFESEEQSEITTTFETAFDWDKLFHEFNSNETRECHPPDEVSEFRLQGLIFSSNHTSITDMLFLELKRRSISRRRFFLDGSNQMSFFSVLVAGIFFFLKNTRKILLPRSTNLKNSGL